MSSILKIAQPNHEMNDIPRIGRFICISAAVQKAYCAWENYKTLEKIEKGGRTRAGDKVLEKTDKAVSKIPFINRIAKALPDSYRSSLHNAKPFIENLGWVLLLTACATNNIPGTASIGILFSLYARPWTREVRGTQWPLAGGFLLCTVIFLKEPLYNLAPLVIPILRPLL